MKKVSLILAAAVMLAGITGCEILNKLKQAGGEASTAASTGSAAYQMPFQVKLGGQGTVAKNAVCAAIANPVSNTAEIVVDAPKDNMIIINAFPCDADANVASGVQPAVIMIKKGENKTTINKTMDNKKLKAGNYVMNVVAAGKTARVFFVVK